MFTEIAERVKNLILANAEAIENDWKENIRKAEEPEKVKFPVDVKIALTNKDGNSKKAIIVLKWRLTAERSLECVVEDEGPQQELGI